uniref:Uncharacterized protein n=1 Tax=Anguilla anguilla TaxID=7936 RepID=A0A0E9X4Z2_ANGAN
MNVFSMKLYRRNIPCVLSRLVTYGRCPGKKIIQISGDIYVSTGFPNLLVDCKGLKSF